MGDDYDPHLHRNRPAPTTYWETLAHMLKGALGTGMLAMPQAFYRAGIYVGAVATIAVGILCTYTIHVLIRTQYILCKREKVGLLSYPDSMKKALEVGPHFLRPLAQTSAYVIDFFLIVYQLGICCVYIVFIAESIEHLLEQHHGEIMSTRLFICCLLPMLLIINMIPTLKKLAPISAIGNVFISVGLGIILYYIFGDGEMSKEELKNYGAALDFPLFIGTTLFALEAVGVVLALENNMENPKLFRNPMGVLNVSSFIVVFLYLFIGLTGYLRYGSQSKDIILKNLPGDQPLAETVRVLYVMAIFISYALNCFVPVEIIWNEYILPKLSPQDTKLMFYNYCLRFILVFITFVVAVATPNVGIFISFFGALCLASLGISFPALLEICTLWESEVDHFKWIVFRDIIIFVAGIMALIMGVYSSANELVES